MNIVKNVQAQIDAENFNMVAMSHFLNQLNLVGAKALFLFGVDSENKIQLVFIDGITLDQVKDLVKQVSQQFERDAPPPIYKA